LMERPTSIIVVCMRGSCVPGHFRSVAGRRGLGRNPGG
jgi:hypothetical protein